MRSSNLRKVGNCVSRILIARYLLLRAVPNTFAMEHSHLEKQNQANHFRRQERQPRYKHGTSSKRVQEDRNTWMCRTEPPPAMKCAERRVADNGLMNSHMCSGAAWMLVFFLHAGDSHGTP